MTILAFLAWCAAWPLILAGEGLAFIAAGPTWAAGWCSHHGFMLQRWAKARRGG